MLKLKQQQILLQLCLLAVSLTTALACHGELLASGVKAEEIPIILSEHNKLRQTVATGRLAGQPGAENMREIVWDDELALRAQKWADNCQFKHDPFRTINRFTMGQNVAIIWSTAPLDPDDGDFPSRIQSWFNEVQKYSFGDKWSLKTGHYSQLVWGETSLVGCGYSEYKDKYKYNKLYVCNYGPGGNVVGFKPYEVGKPSCPSHGMSPSSRYNGLCSAPGGSTGGHNINAIETYDYNNNNKATYSYNTYKTYNTKQQTSKYTTTNTNTQYNNHNDNDNENTFSNNYQHRQQATSYNLQQTQQQTSSATAAAAAAATSSATAKKISSSYNGFSYGSKTNGGSFTFTTEATQPQYNKYRNKLESYKPSPEEFKRSVFKHTILRTSLGQDQQAENVYDTKPTKPGVRGWSLLTWRG